jgi:RimJ/RimL family protein N-acetyltransferase
VTGNVRLTRLDEQTLHLMLSIAVAETEPDEVMPPVTAPAGGWCEARREAFREFYRSSFNGLDGPIRTLMYAIICDGTVVGMIRMACRDEPDTVETGMWLGRSHRGIGIGRAALQFAPRRGGGGRNRPRRGRDHLPKHRGSCSVATLWGRVA